MPGDERPNLEHGTRYDSSTFMRKLTEKYIEDPQGQAVCFCECPVASSGRLSARCRSQSCEHRPAGGYTLGSAALAV